MRTTACPIVWARRFGGNARHLAILSGAVGHVDEAGTLDRVDVILEVNTLHQARFTVAFFDLDSGQRRKTILAEAVGERTYGLAVVVPVIVYSDTVGTACGILDREPAAFVATAD